MSTYRLDKLFAPQSVAVVGASPREKSVGRAILQNLRSGGFSGSIFLVNPNHDFIDGVRAFKSIGDLPSAPDLLVITAPPASVPSIIADAGKNGVQTAIIITAGLGHGPGSIAERAEREARATGLRLLGPNCLGAIAPFQHLNASFAARMPLAGDLALISQSGAIAAGMVDWAVRQDIGFSAIASVGDQLDIDVADLLDFFALDRKTRSILLYIESVKDARKFMSAARAAARIKPVVVVKSGRHREAAKAAATHTGALAGSDAVYDAAFRRAGLLRVLDLGELFDAAETLGKIKSVDGQRLAILTNGGGIGVLAIDRLLDLGGVPARLSDSVRATLDKALPPTWSKANPVDIIGDADAARYTAALEALLADPENDAVLVLNVETALASALSTAKAIGAVTERQRTQTTAPKPVLAVWVGADSTVAEVFNQAGMAHYATESDAVRGFMHLVSYAAAKRTLSETPPSLPQEFQPDPAKASVIVTQALAKGRSWLDPADVANVLHAYSIPALPVHIARNPDEAAAAAKTLLANYNALVVKILSDDIIHKSDVHGVRLDLTSEDAVRTATKEVIDSARAAKPAAVITGVTIYPMIVRPNARELIAGVADDATFGPIIVFGCGGTAVEIVNDKAVALPPLDLNLAHDLIGRTQVARVLRAYRNVPAARTDELALVLVKLAQLSADVPQIREIDLNPILADENGVVVLDARVAIADAGKSSRRFSNPRFAIRPYPKEWERDFRTSGGLQVHARPVRPEDEPLLQRFLKAVSPDDLRLRFFAPVKEFGHDFIARLTQIDYDRAMAFLALDESGKDLLGVVRLHSDANHHKAEYAILLRSDLKGFGLGWSLMELVIAYARNEGLKQIEGQVLRENTTMLQMCKELGFDIIDDPEDSSLKFAKLDIGTVR